MALIFGVFVMLGVPLAKAASTESVFEWHQLDFDWFSLEDEEQALANGDFIPENNVLFGAAIYQDTAFLTVPRWREGVPSTLNEVHFKAEKSAPLRPYPSWENNVVGYCPGMQNVLRIHIDNYGRLWVVDAGTVNVRSDPVRFCPPKLLIFDVITHQLLRIYEFPKDVATEKGYLSNIVVDTQSGDPDDAYAYIAETQGNSIVVYSFKKNKSWRVSDPSMYPDPEASEFNVDGYKSTKMVGIVPIALSPVKNDTRLLYYSPLSSYKLFALPTDVLKDEEASKDVSERVMLIGRRPSQTGAMTMDDDGVMYYDLKGTSSLFSWDSNTTFTAENQKLVTHNDDSLRYVTTLFMDDGFLWAVSNDFHLHRDEGYTFDKPHFHLVKITLN